MTDAKLRAALTEGTARTQAAASIPNKSKDPQGPDQRGFSNFLDSRTLREHNPPDSPLRRAVLSNRSAHPLRRFPLGSLERSAQSVLISTVRAKQEFIFQNVVLGGAP